MKKIYWNFMVNFECETETDTRKSINLGVSEAPMSRQWAVGCFFFC